MLAEIALISTAMNLCLSSLSRRMVRLLAHTQQPDLAVALVVTLILTLFIGCCLIAIGSLLRPFCYRVLGRLELSIRNEHKLIKSGPYAIVQHPSYLGIMSLFLGLSMKTRGWSLVQAYSRGMC
ncbi:hypothetical protein J3A83DRAFT_1678213 [Scleroderma citrinum]